VWSGKMVGNICRRRVEIGAVDIGTQGRMVALG
jgi:hypothetical protein